jgi:hypothetical protein
MSRNRRDFIKATASIGLLGMSEASGKPNQKARLRVAAASPYIGVVTSINIGSGLKSAFLNGYKANGGTLTSVQYNPASPDGQYGLQTMVNIVKMYDSDSNCKLIVTVGGFVTFVAANSYVTATSQKKFISLVGGTMPVDSWSSRLYGGVSLGSIALNMNRIIYLVNNKNQTMANIALLQNLNSQMRTQEHSNWTTLGSGPVVFGGNNASGANYNTFSTDFTNLPSSVTAVIISADPFFQDSKQQLISAANTWLMMDLARYVCYPLQDFQNSGVGTTSPQGGQSTLLGPSLAGANATDITGAYYILGQQAALAIKATAPLAIVPAPWSTTDIPST